MMKEIELIDKFCEYLKQNNYVYKRELRRGSYYNEGFVDIVIQNDQGILCAVEAKITAFTSVLHQAAGNRGYFTYSYILYPRLPTRSLIDKTRHYETVGLILPTNETFTEFKVVLKPKAFGYQYHSHSEWKIQRNWDENRVGRYLTEKEFPPGYSNEQREQLKPDYSYTYKLKSKPLRKIHSFEQKEKKIRQNVSLDTFLKSK